MHLEEVNPEDTIAFLNQLAAEHDYTKIIAKVRKSQSEDFLRHGFRVEAAIPLFYRYCDDVVFLAKYLSQDRAISRHQVLVDTYLALAQSRTVLQSGPDSLPEGTHIRVCSGEDAEEMSALYRTVFKTYPFPIHDPAYIRETMQSHIMYFAVKSCGRLIALSSAEMNLSDWNVEMTDFAVDPAWQGQGLAVCLLARMEEEMVRRNITTAYTIARSLSPSMNITFAKMAYHFGGTVTNNTNIAGQIESMNIWYKSLVGTNAE
jgi:putative beta-lysine N-acetyltransferase